MTSNQDWWPDQLNLKGLRQNSLLSDRASASWCGLASIPAVKERAICIS